MVVQYSNPEIKAALTENDKKQCLDVRVKVFVDEQKYTLESEIHDKYDSVSDHWLLTCQNMDGVRVPVGTVRMYMVGEKVGKLGRLAVLPDARGLRCGQSLVKTLLQSAYERGLDAIMCEAQVDKRGFYEKLGFVIEKGDEEAYPVDGTPHYKMWKRSLP